MGYSTTGSKSVGFGRYLSLICFHTQIHKDIIHTVLSGQCTDMKVGGDEWLISAEWRGRRELNELSLFWGLCMRIHCYIFTVASGKKIWVSLWFVFFCVLSAKIPISPQRQKHTKVISYSQTTVCFRCISVWFPFSFNTRIISTILF